MNHLISMLTAVSVAAVFLPRGVAQSPQRLFDVSPLVEIENEPPPKLFVDAPLPGPLASGRVFIQYRTENIRILPVFGKGALSVSPRIGHVHITIDDAPWHFVDASGGAIVLVGLPAGAHDVLVELANPVHQVIDRRKISFVIPTTQEPAEPSK